MIRKTIPIIFASDVRTRKVILAHKEEDSFRAVANKAARDRARKLKTRTVKDKDGEGIAIQALSGFQPNDPIWILDDEGGREKGVFLRPGDPDEARVDPKIDVPRDIAWVRTEEEEIEQRFYRQVKARD